jgi:hypothetical protein
LFHFTDLRAKTKCELDQEEKQRQLLVGAYIPQCEEDGSYSRIQCHGSTGYCWCSDGDGNKMVETEVRYERPNCSEGEIPYRNTSLFEKQYDIKAMCYHITQTELIELSNINEIVK